MGAMGMGRRESTRVPALRVSVLLMGLREAARAPDQPSEASTPSESTTPDSAGVRAPPGCRARQVARGFKTWLEGLFSHPTRSDFPGGAEAVRPTARQISSLRVRRTWPDFGPRLRRTCRSSRCDFEGPPFLVSFRPLGACVGRSGETPNGICCVDYAVLVAVPLGAGVARWRRLRTRYGSTHPPS